MEEAQASMKSLQEQGPGRTIISDSVVAKIAGIAAREVRGVHELGGMTERAISRITGATKTTGVAVEVGEQEAAVDLNLIADYGQSIPEVASKVRQNVINQIESMTGLNVTEVNISVNDLYFPEEAKESEQQRVA